MSHEELIIRHACGLPLPSLRRERTAAGTMMLPIPRGGFLKGVSGLDAALEVPGIEDIVVTARPHEKLQPFPEGSSYPGFIFARAEDPRAVERALREASRRLRLDIAPSLDML